MGKALITLVNPNKVQPGIPPYALDILTTLLEQNDFDVEVVDLTFQRHRWRTMIKEYFSNKKPLLVGVTIRNTNTGYPQEQRSFVEDHLEIITEIKRFVSAPIVAGGVGFSSMPYALMEYFDIPYGIKGPGELLFANLANCLLNGEKPTGMPGLLVRDEIRLDPMPKSDALESPAMFRPRVEQVNRVTAYKRRSGIHFKVDNFEYYQKGGLGNILTENGCHHFCTHCIEPDAKGHLPAHRDPKAVVDEMETLADQGVHDLHSSDGEFNVDLGRAKLVLKEMIARKKNGASPLHKLRLWLYCQPVPFDEELAGMLAEAGCAGINFGSDHSCQEMLDKWKVTKAGKTLFTFDDVRKANRLTQENGMLSMHDIMLAMPGETMDTLRRCIDDTLSLNATVIGYTLGVWIIPYSPLGIQLAEACDGVRTVKGLQSNFAISPIVLKPLHKCQSAAEYERQFMFDEFHRLRPVYYFSPELDEDEETIDNPSGRWNKTLQFMWDYIPQEDYERVMLPTGPGLTKDDNNYADNPFLMCLAGLGYKGAFWAKWRERDRIMQEAVEKGILKVHQYEAYRFAIPA